MTDTDTEAWRHEHGLYYVGRDSSTVVRLDFDALPPFRSRSDYEGTADYMVQGPERAILKALLLHALKTIEEADNPLYTVPPVAYPVKPKGSPTAGR